MRINIFVALVDVVTWTEDDEIDIMSDTSTTLSRFLRYRSQKLSKKHPNDFAVLLTGHKFEGNIVGQCEAKMMCSNKHSGAVVTMHDSKPVSIASTIAHEMGHSFGMPDEWSDTNCTNKRSIMYGASQGEQTEWSECSIEILKSALKENIGYCLQNMPKKIFNEPTCGNGFVEHGEECDCGLPGYCENKCCDPRKCKLTAIAKCATGKCCDLERCQVRQAGHVCRRSTGECDLREFCDGENEFCPKDYVKNDAIKCQSEKGVCFKGACKSRDDQCEILWGSSIKSNEPCYEYNKDGNRLGSCGYLYEIDNGNIYEKCSKENVQCGLLQCQYAEDNLKFGPTNFFSTASSYIWNGTDHVLSCQSATFHFNSNVVDPGFVADDTKCSIGGMCLNHTCVSIDELRAQRKISVCPCKCYKECACDKDGNCHCYDDKLAPDESFDWYDTSSAAVPSSLDSFYLMFLITLGFSLF